MSGSTVRHREIGTGAMLTGFPPPTGAGGCAQPPVASPPSEPGGHAQFESLRSCLAAALRSRRLCLLQDYEKFKQRNQLLIQAQRAELARLELDAAASAHATEQAQLLFQSPLVIRQGGTA